MSIILSLNSLVNTSLSRPSGYLEDVLYNAQIEGDRVKISQNRYYELVMKYRGTSPVKVFQEYKETFNPLP